MTERVIRPEDFQVFTFKGHELHVIVEEGEPLFLASDVCKALGYEGTRDAIAAHCKSRGAVKHRTLTGGGNQIKNFINEANVFHLVTGSKLPEAGEFLFWMSNDILSSIRETEKRDLEAKEAEHDKKRVNYLRKWIYRQGIYNSPSIGKNLFLPSSILLHSMEVMGFIRKDAKLNWVATRYALESSFCVKTPVREYVESENQSSSGKRIVRYAFAMTEAGVNEYAHGLREFEKKFSDDSTAVIEILGVLEYESL